MTPPSPSGSSETARANPKPRWRRGVGAVLFNKDGHVLMGLRYDAVAEAWQFPQGGIDRHESTEHALFRELREEIGTDNVEIIADSGEWLRYWLPPDLRARLWNGLYVGQEQWWYLLRFLGRDEDVKLDVSARPEFRAWRWFPLAKAHERIVPFKRDVYQRLVQRFTPPLQDALTHAARKPPGPGNQPG